MKVIKLKGKWVIQRTAAMNFTCYVWLCKDAFSDVFWWSSFDDYAMTFASKQDGEAKLMELVLTDKIPLR